MSIGQFRALYGWIRGSWLLNVSITAPEIVIWKRVKAACRVKSIVRDVVVVSWNGEKKERERNKGKKREKRGKREIKCEG